MAGKKRTFGFDIPDFGLGSRRSGARGRNGGAHPEPEMPVEQNGGPYGALAGRLEMVRRRKQACLGQSPSPERRRQ